MASTPTTRKDLRAKYAELRYCASGFIMHDCFPVKDAPEMAGLLQRIHELCTPQMVLCLLDDVETSEKPRRTGKKASPARTWWCDGCKKFIGGAEHQCLGVKI